VLVVGSPRTGAGDALVVDLRDGSERTLAVRDVLEHPAAHFAELGGERHA